MGDDVTAEIISDDGSTLRVRFTKHVRLPFLAQALALVDAEYQRNLHDPFRFWPSVPEDRDG